MVMLPGEIAREYAAASNPRKQIGILAELNQCSRDDIRTILREQGVELPRPGRPKKEPEPKPTPEETFQEPFKAFSELKGSVGKKPEDVSGKEALGLVVRAAAVDAIAELLRRNETTDYLFAAGFREQVRGVLALVHEIEREAENAGED